MGEITKRVKPGETCYFTVAGAGDFPFDMLRYDACWPASSADATALSGGAHSESMPQRQIVLACKPGDNWRFVPTHGRWNSFTWTAGALRYSERDY